MDKEAELKEKNRLLSLAMERLSSVQREVIQRSYLDNEGEFDYISCGEMRTRDSTYRRIISGAMELMDAALGLELYLRDSIIIGVR
ncbi:hypothetical protein [Paenibacillus xylanexedens]|uniref:hypothetical protein n=1 Tax=Paenibacillus xylanexedens TaxID=528191 RepID=UPI001C92D008|nr:hypothetical protein [Paenibacillus xylanexedens]